MGLKAKTIFTFLCVWRVFYAHMPCLSPIKIFELLYIFHIIKILGCRLYLSPFRLKFGCLFSQMFFHQGLDNWETLNCYS